MASLQPRSDSPYWWINYKDANGKRQFESTKLRRNSTEETRLARKQCTEKTLEEIGRGNCRDAERFDSWVLDFMRNRYGDSKTFVRQRNRWDALNRFLGEQKIFYPRHVKYGHAVDYLNWRQKEDEVCRNTAIYELKALSLFMSEAVKRGFAPFNPIVKLGLKKDAEGDKPEMIDVEIAKIRAALNEPSKHFQDASWIDKDREWMRIAFEIAIHQGCRLTETRIHRRNVDFVNGRITFHAKGGKIFTTKLHPALAPFLKEVFSDGRSHSLELPHVPSKAWWKFFKKLKMRHLCFHCTRVTVITKLARDGVPISQAMRFVGHASETIHRVYQRLSVDDLDRCTTALTYNQTQQS